jgi:metal-sulfur cluster biosynthetic enzyme
MTSELHGRVAAALQQVTDPCSAASRTPMSIVDLGLLEDAQLVDGHLHVTLCVTAPNCLMIGTIIHATRVALAGLDGVDLTEVTIDPTLVWEPTRIAPAAAQRIDEHRRRSLELLPLAPAPSRGAV